MSKALYVLAGYDDHTESYLAGIQNSLYEKGFTGTHTKNLPQHITLGSFPTEMEETLKQQLLDVKTERFSVGFHHIGLFSRGEVLFIAPDHNRDLLALKEQFGSSENWTAHTTMLIDTPENIRQALPVVVENFAQFTGQVTSLHLYEFWPTRHILTVDLK